jgi:copper chaperone NosL
MKRKIGTVTRVLLLVCAVALAIVLFVPVWRIDLTAPQYPEGLYLLIYANKLTGNVDIINGLNHYIGMKTLHTGDFFEFTILPYLIGLFSLLFLITAIVGSRRVLRIVFSLFLLFGIIAMIDFWKWEYNYGHNLNPEAAIKVPGMSYQPPLIGYKQLLNFSAYSMADIGGWIFVGVGAIALFCVIKEWRAKWKPARKTVMSIFIAGTAISLASCNTTAEPIKLGVDNCTFCKMTISDARYGAEIVTKKGKTYKFDDAHCVLSYLKKLIPANDVSEVYFVDFDGKHEFVNVKNAIFFKSDDLNTPMGGNVAAVSNRESMQKLSGQFKGAEVSWQELTNK